MALRGSRRQHIIKRVKRQITRFRHRRGHGVHSPYIYNIVREVFMDRKREWSDTPLFRALTQIGISNRNAQEIVKIGEHCGYTTFGVDVLSPLDIIICSTNAEREMVEETLKLATRSGTTVVIQSPYLTPSRGVMCDEIIAHHHSTTVNRRGYLVVFNNHLPKQHFTL